VLRMLEQQQQQHLERRYDLLARGYE